MPSYSFLTFCKIGYDNNPPGLSFSQAYQVVALFNVRLWKSDNASLLTRCFCIARKFFLVRSGFGLELVNRVPPGIVGVDGGDVELLPVTTVVLNSGDTVFDPVPAGNVAITLGWEGAVLFQLIAFL
jgi:hypothetical protein